VSTIRDIGEFDLIERLAARLEPLEDGVGIGDDAAAWQPTPGRLTVATTDMLVEGVHFRLEWTSARDLGWKALAVNLSDLAAMGARPGNALVSIGLLPDRTVLVEELYDGMAELARLTGTRIVGGDTVRSTGPLIINVAVFGEAAPERLLRRNGARVGDVLVVSGSVGASAAGLALLLENDAAALARPEIQPLFAAHHKPWPQLDLGAALAETGVRCAIDVSDGVASEAWHLARASGVEIEVDVERLPLAKEAVTLLGRPRALELGLRGGEDYQLLFTVPESRLAEISAAIPPDVALTAIGRVTSERPGGSVRFLESGTVAEIPEAGYVAF
jgi:thiamine-monophosphate kinase